jgi:two-component system copper resistance phosphate regulon response regulator CusR
MRILVIEDVERIAATVEQGLREHHFAVDVAHDGETGLRLAMSEPYDLITLDMMLPGLDGWTVLSRLRKSGKTVPVLILTARDRVEDRVKGLEMGADDYLVKPFAFAELLARIHSVLRRGPQRQADVIRIADLEIDVLRHRTSRGGHKIDLTPKEFSLLVLLARRQGEVVSRTAISEAVWDINFDSFTNVVDVNVRRLRAKLDDPFELKLIRTVRGVGYVLDDTDDPS